MTDKPRIGVIGVGHLGKAHVRVLSNLESCELVGCYDILSEKSEAAAADNNTKAFTDAQELIAECDAISLVAPTSEHYKCAIEILNAGKHLFVEKPIAATVDEAREMINLADKLNLKLAVGHIERFNPAVIALADKISHPTFIEGHRLAPFNFRGLDVAVIFDLMIHDIDLCLFLTKSKVVDIQASAAAVVSDHMDIANARLTFESGCVANLTASRISAKPMRKLRIFQTKGYISIDFSAPSAAVYNLLDSGETMAEAPGFTTTVDYGDAGKKIAYSKPNIEPYDMLTAELESFIDAVTNDGPVAVSGEDGLRALTIAAEIEKIAQAGLDKLQLQLR
ncbi:MAG: Gfo/Idh/MocA family oxidoreductase [candidate division Zixibacteria bacterium]|nr:Gfo/Idh/MocA family oxidoreductase [candidate division Zixibacteria bacterium]MBU1470122.1 Gfo/Idh/MocA family oxidoreductase [candidate division Zixibacteria bacterium]MBU2626491.1 Gfo/Idh/MocA family oxidoreductase [candidate division Zixibacteria bacterium]